MGVSQEVTVHRMTTIDSFHCLAEGCVSSLGVSSQQCHTV